MIQQVFFRQVQASITKSSVFGENDTRRSKQTNSWITTSVSQIPKNKQWFPDFNVFFGRTREYFDQMKLNRIDYSRSRKGSFPGACQDITSLKFVFSHGLTSPCYGKVGKKDQTLKKAFDEGTLVEIEVGTQTGRRIHDLSRAPVRFCAITQLNFIVETLIQQRPVRKSQSITGISKVKKYSKVNIGPQERLIGVSLVTC